MRNVAMLLLVGAVLFQSCSNKGDLPIPEPVEEIPNQVIHEPRSFPVSETKQPFAELSDKGFEAMLIFYEIDSDNQINGKVSLEDLKKVTTLTFQYQPDVTYREKRAFIERTYGEIPKMSSFDDIKLLSNLRMLGSYAGKHLDLSNNLELEEIQLYVPAIKTINLQNLKKLKKIDFYPPIGVGYIPSPNIRDFKEIDLTDNTALEVLKYYGNAPTLDLNKNVNLREAYLHSAEFKQTTLDLTKNTKLEILDCTGLFSVKEILITQETLDKISKSPENWKKPQDAVWKVKG